MRGAAAPAKQDGDVPVTTQSLKPRQDATQTQAAAAAEPYGPIVLRLPPAMGMTDELLVELCGLNQDIRIELNAEGELELMPPTLPVTGNRNASITSDLTIWARGNGWGVAFDSSAGFTLPNGALRSPDASWIRKTRIAELTSEQREGFWSICPDFVVELRSASDTLRGLHHKMEEYMENGARLGWLIDPLDSRRRVYIYRPNAPVEILDGPETLSGEPELLGFTLNLQPVWEPAF